MFPCYLFYIGLYRFRVGVGLGAPMKIVLGYVCNPSSSKERDAASRTLRERLQRDRLWIQMQSVP